MLSVLFAALVAFAGSTLARRATITTYPDAPFPHSTLFTVTVNSLPITVLNAGRFNLSTFATSTGPLDVTVKFLGGPITNHSLLPAGADLTGASVRGSAISFRLANAAPRKVELRVNYAVSVIGNPSDPVLYLFVDAPEVKPRSPTGTSPRLLPSRKGRTTLVP